MTGVQICAMTSRPDLVRDADRGSAIAWFREPCTTQSCLEPVGAGWSLRGDPVLATELHERDSDGRRAYWDSLEEDEWYERMVGAA